VKFGVSEVGANLSKLTAVVETISLGEEPGCGDEILDSSDNWLSISRCDHVEFGGHEFESFCTSLFSLRDVYNSK